MGYPRHEDGQYIKVRKVFTKDSLARENHDPKALKVSQKMLDWECIETDVIINDFPCSSIERRVHIMSQDTWAVHLSSTGRHFRTVGIATHHAANEGEESAPSTRAVLPSMLADRSLLDTRSIEGPPSLIPRKWKFFNVHMGTPYQRYDLPTPSCLRTFFVRAHCSTFARACACSHARACVLACASVQYIAHYLPPPFLQICCTCMLSPSLKFFSLTNVVFAGQSIRFARTKWDSTWWISTRKWPWSGLQ